MERNKLKQIITSTFIFLFHSTEYKLFAEKSFLFSALNMLLFLMPSH